MGLGSGFGPGHIVLSSVLLPCLGRPPSFSVCDPFLVHASQAARSATLSCMSAHTNPASSLATATAAIRLFFRNASRLNTLWSRCCAFQLCATASAG